MWFVWILSALAVPPEAPPFPLADAMHARFAALTAARDAIVDGRLEDAHLAVAPLAEPDPAERFPPQWRPQVARVEREARAVAAAKTVDTAADGVARTAQACAECHIARAAGPEWRERPTPAWEPGQNMPLHAWAENAMWAGLLAGNEAAWRQGAKALDDQPLALRFDRAPPPGGQRELEQLVYLIANKALQTEELAARAELYGDLLGTCAQCHIQRGGKP